MSIFVKILQKFKKFSDRTTPIQFLNRTFENINHLQVYSTHCKDDQWLQRTKELPKHNFFKLTQYCYQIVSIVSFIILYALKSQFYFKSRDPLPQTKFEKLSSVQYC